MFEARKQQEICLHSARLFFWGGGRGEKDARTLKNKTKEKHMEFFKAILFLCVTALPQL